MSRNLLTQFEESCRYIWANISAVATGQTPLDKNSSAISKQQEKKLAENKRSTRK
jgi:hypothetical protein